MNDQSSTELSTDLFLQLELGLKALEEDFHKKQDEQILSFPKQVREYNTKALRKARVLSLEEKIEKKLRDIDGLNETLSQSILKKQNKIDNLNQSIEQASVSIERKRSKIEDRTNIFSDLGFDYQQIEPNVFEVQWSRLPIAQFDQVFTFRISIDDKDGAKVLECCPPECINLDLVEREMSKWTKPKERSFVRLILIIRKQLIQSDN